MRIHIYINLSNIWVWTSATSGFFKQTPPKPCILFSIMFVIWGIFMSEITYDTKQNDGKKYVLRHSLRIILYLISKLLTVGQGQIYLVGFSYLVLYHLYAINDLIFKKSYTCYDFIFQMINDILIQKKNKHESEELNLFDSHW